MTYLYFHSSLSHSCLLPCLASQQGARGGLNRLRLSLLVPHTIMTPVGYINEDQYCAACHGELVPRCALMQLIMWRAGSQDLSSIGLRKERAACRYYQTGNCRRGSGCPFAHISTAAQVECQCPNLCHPVGADPRLAPTIPHPAYPGEHMYSESCRAKHGTLITSTDSLLSSWANPCLSPPGLPSAPCFRMATLCSPFAFL